jgi:hypothetical protein
VTLRRGFKKEAKEIALATRRELGIDVFAPLDPYVLAELYGIEVFDLGDQGLPSAGVQYFTVTRPDRFSAALVPIGTGAIVIENHAHELPRRRSTMAHEMAHVLLEHEFGLLFAGEDGCRSSNSAVEEEATELSGELLIPTDSAKQAAFNGWPDEQVAAFFQVSEPMARWRMNATGARLIASRGKKKWH